MIAGIDIGGTTTKIGLVLDGRVLDTVRIATAGEDSPGNIEGNGLRRSDHPSVGHAHR